MRLSCDDSAVRRHRLGGQMRNTSKEVRAMDRSGLTVHHPADRWAHLVWATRDLAYDPRTLADWAKAVGVSVPTLRARCYVAGVSPRASLTLTRLVRELRLASLEG